jgi:isopenicillin N synthase-like dioxygenase
MTNVFLFLPLIILRFLPILASLEIPVIDISSLASPENLDVTQQQKRRNTLEEIHRAASTYGVFIITNYTVNPVYSERSILQSGFNLFSLEEQVKLKSQFNATNHFGRGYLSFGSESGLSDYFEPKEGYSYGYPSQQEKDYGWLTSPNIWPEEFPSDDQFQLETIYKEFSRLANLIVLSLIQFRKDHLLYMKDLSIDEGEKISLMRLFHYFTVSEEEQREQLETHQKRYVGSSPHTDWGLLTIILHNAIGGLQFYHDNQWMDVPTTIPNSLVINIGDYFALATNQEYVSPIHRVLTPTEQDRLSYVYFFYPNFRSELIASEKTTAVLENNPGNGKSIPEGILDEEGNMDQQQKTAQVHFNTLTMSEIEEVSYRNGLEEDDGSKKLCFGDYILFKWKSVLRQ